MYSTRLLSILMLALSILISTRAAWFDGRQIQGRQDLVSVGVGAADSTTSDASAETTTSEPSETTTESADTTTEDTSTPTTTPEETSEDTPTPTPTPDTTTTPDEPSTTETPSTTEDTATTPTDTATTGPITSPPTTTTDGSSQPTSDAGDSSSEDSSSDGSSSKKTTTHKPTTSTTIVLTTITQDGHTTVSSSASAVTYTPGLNADGSADETSGLSQDKKNIIIGVTVGVGGAIVLAVLGLLVWRLRSKKRNQEENEELVSYGNGFGGPGTAEKSEASGPSATTSRSPFQSTLESYHAPTRANAASNF
ncbi:hypothetical protein F4780DRAFT_285458 [Xylariomycetidae sp. FL0641]|nr:hypothetical protein F4780DRAFT_285458 [Xylariomycetidae sp. FL0641]